MGVSQGFADGRITNAWLAKMLLYVIGSLLYVIGSFVRLFVRLPDHFLLFPCLSDHLSIIPYR